MMRQAAPRRDDVSDFVHRFPSIRYIPRSSATATQLVHANVGAVSRRSRWLEGGLVSPVRARYRRCPCHVDVPTPANHATRTETPAPKRSESQRDGRSAGHSTSFLQLRVAFFGKCWVRGFGGCGRNKNSTIDEFSGGAHQSV
jgi:hypothetical protein